MALRLNYDLHNTLGFYSAILVIIMCLTGLSWSFEWYRDGVKTVVGAPLFRVKNQKPMEVTARDARAKRAGLSSMLHTARTHFGNRGDVDLRLPQSPDQAIGIRVSKPSGFFAAMGTDRMQLDPYSGEILDLEYFDRLPMNMRVLDMNRNLHTGAIFGTSSKLLYFLCCLIATSLPVTGFIVWFGKLKKKRKPEHRVCSIN